MRYCFFYCTFYTCYIKVLNGIGEFICVFAHTYMPLPRYLVVTKLLPSTFEQKTPPQKMVFFSRGGGAFSISGFQLSYFIKDDLEYLNIFDR